jgi:hypothetical protein
MGMRRFSIKASLLVATSIILASCATMTPSERSVETTAQGGPAAPVSSFVGKPEGPSVAIGEVVGIVVPNAVVRPQVSYEEAPRALGEDPVLIEPVRPKRPPLPDGGARGIGRYVGLPDGQAPTSPPPAPDPSAKTLSSVFLANSTDNNSVLTGGFLFIPPDNHVAAGPGHVVTVTNVAIQIHTKAAAPNLVFNQSLRTFFATLAVPAGNFTFDPKVLYDDASGRWIVMTMERTDNGAAAGTSRLLVAASEGSDPTVGVWRFTAINSNVLSGGFNHWADFPGFAVDEEAIYISTNLFRYQFQGFTYGGSRLWIIPKTPFYNGAAFATSLIDPYAGLAPGAATTLASRMIGAPAGNTGVWLTSAGWSAGANESVRVLRIDNPLGAPAVNSQFINLGDVDSAGALPLAPQLGDPAGPTLDAGDRRSHDALWRDNALWMSFTTNPPAGVDAGQSTVRWVQISTGNPAALALLGQGAIGGETIAAGTHTYYGNIGVTASGRVVIGFSASSAATRPGAFYATRLPGDAAGSTRAPILLRAGEGYYFRDFGGGDNRWGDYSGAAVDLATDCVWVYNQYSLPPAANNIGGTGRWGTAGGRVCPGLVTSITVDAPNPSPSMVGQSVTIPFTLSETPPDATLNPSGTVTINASTGESCSAALPATSCTITFAASGTRNLTASYSGDANFDSSTSAPRAHTVNPAGPASTTLLLNAQSVNPSVVGQSVAFPFTLSVVPPGTGTPTGTVTVSAGAGETCTATLPTSTCSITFSSAGARTLTATYSGSANFSASTSPTRSHSVNAAATSVVLSSQSFNPSVVGQSVSFPFTLSVTAPGTGTPTGTVTVSAGAGESCTATLPTNSCSITFTSAGARSVSASYAGTANFAASSSSTRSHMVNPAPTALSLNAQSVNPSVVGQSVSFPFALVVPAPGGGVPTGTVTVSAGAGESCTATLPTNSCSITFTSAGARTVSASYAGTANFAASGSSARAHTVNPAATTTTITSNTPNPSASGQAVTVSWTLGVSAPGAGVPGGTMTITASGGAETCQATLPTSSCVITLLGAGPRTLTASYGGTPSFTASSGTAAHTVIGDALIFIDGFEPSP